jgi:phosphoribosylformimino-5-aminoimidazole carboxamide ribotide isomerase
MLIPSIDLQGGRIVQLVQGEKLALQTDDFEGWIERFARYPKVQLIDLDAAKDEGSNTDLAGALCARLPCRIGGGIRTIARAEFLLAEGARKVIFGSSLFHGGDVDTRFAAAAAKAVGPERLIAAVDAKQGRVAINGWRTILDITPIEAIRQLEPFVSEFLFTNVDIEGLMQGIDRGAVRAVREATIRDLAAAGGVTTQEEVDWLDSIRVDAVAGMAIYMGRLRV